jgi:phenylpropionate dioxygenase-like ring-hydroxylating dioxygenase large terminal subunit
MAKMFLRNGWYTTLWSHELKDKPVAKTFLDDKIVLFRNASGQIGALEYCCCHRAAPLSLGEISGEYLACGYHGLKFNTNGQCVEVPGQTHVPTGAKVRSYPVLEKWSVVWIWMGDPTKADPGRVPDMPWLSDPKWATTPGRLYVKSNYQFIVDNLPPRRVVCGSGGRRSYLPIRPERGGLSRPHNEAQLHRLCRTGRYTDGTGITSARGIVEQRD